MKNFKTGYAYLFFFFYNSLNSVKNNIFIKFKSILMVVLLEFMVVIFITTYYLNLSKTIFPNDFNRLYLLIPITPIIALNMWFFERNENWKGFIVEFNEWPIEKKKRWNWIMRIIIGFVFFNFILSFYFMSQIDWKQYR